MAQHNALVGLAELAAQGLTREELASHYGVCVQTVVRIAEIRGVALARKPHPVCKKDLVRIEKMTLMYSQGCTLERIGAHFEITRERVRQILSKAGVTANDGGRSVKAAQKKASKRAQNDARWIAKYGMTYAEVRPYQRRRLTSAYRQQSTSAANRGIKFSLTFLQWLSIWESSGKIELRGKGKGHYCMSRIVDTGGYEVGNVHIQLVEDNSREAVKKWRGKTKPNRGVFHLYPGSDNPWMAKAGKKRLGCFATEAEAVAVRDAWLTSNPPANTRAGRAQASA